MSRDTMTAGALLEACLQATGAAFGWVDRVQSGGDGHDAVCVFCEAGGKPYVAQRPSYLDPLVTVCCTEKRVVYENNGSASSSIKRASGESFMLRSTLLIPLLSADRIIGILGLSNKPGGFDEHDTLVATGLGALASKILAESDGEESCERENRFKRFFNSSVVGMAVTSPEKGWLEVNDRLCEILGYSREELFGMTWAELTHPDDLAADEEHFNQVLAGDYD